MRAHFLQHVAFEGLGSIRTWLDSCGAAVTSTRFFDDATLPRGDDIDLLLVMGGPMSVNDEDLCPWLFAEKRFIREMINRGKAVLGACLGAQLIASALGSRVYPSAEKEIGWFPIESALSSENNHAFNFPEECLAFHWHGETFDLPQGAIHLARSEACQNQAFQFGDRVIGLQFHLEMTPQSAREIVRNCRHELIPGKFVESEESLLSAPTVRYADTNRLMNEVLSYLVHPEMFCREERQ